MNAYYPMLLILLTIFISCQKNNSIADTEKKYYTFLGEKANDFYTEKKPQKHLKDPTLIYKQMQSLDAIDFSDWDNKYYNTGDVITTPGNIARVYDYKKNNSLTVINTEKFDAVVSIYRKTNSSIVRVSYGEYYLKSGEKLSINNITEGNYILHSDLGTHWKEKKEVTQSYTQALSKRKNIKSTRIHSQFSENRHTFHKDSISFSTNTKRTITLSNSMPYRPSPNTINSSKIVYENQLGEALSDHEISRLFGSKKRIKKDKIKALIVDGILECYVINVE